MTLAFSLQAAGRGPIALTVAQPVWDDGLGAWVCCARWSGAIDGQVKIYGATSLQSITLALANVATEFSAVFGEAGLTEDGRPWF